MLAIQQEPTPDLNPDTLGALSQLMVAQAQQVFVHKAIHGKYNQKKSLLIKCNLFRLFTNVMCLMEKRLRGF